MAPRSARKKAAPKRASGGAESDAVDVVEALATRLAQLGAQIWRLQELESALEQAAGALEDEALRAHIQSNLGSCAQALHERLLSLQADAEQQQQQQQEAAEPAEQQQRAGKRAPKRGKQVAGPGAEAPAEVAAPEEPPLPHLATSAGYGALAAAEAAGQPDARFSPAALLLARRLPAPELVLAHVRRLLPDLPPATVAGGGTDGAGGEPVTQAQAAAALQAAHAAVGLCSALACEAQGPVHALRVFAPAVSQLADAAQQLEAWRGSAGAATAAAAAAAALQELAQLAGRALASMTAALRQQRLAPGGALRAACGFWRTSPQQPAPAAAAGAACAASADICSLLTSLRLRSSSGVSGKLRQQVEALAAAAAADLRQLAPYAGSGQLAELASLPLEEACSGSDAARRFLVLYSGAAKQEISGERDYLTRLAATRTAAAAAKHLGEEALAAAVTAEACGLPASQAFVGWLEDQPPSSIVAAALDASRRGLDSLSHHLVQECGERALAALLAAMQRSGEGGAGAEAGGEAGEGALDDLLFFADKEGDGPAFGRDWGMELDDSEEEDEYMEAADEEESEKDDTGGRRGRRGRLALEGLPGGRRHSTALDGED